MAQYHRALCKEIVEVAAQMAQPIDIQTIYFGGGTPSTYPNELLLDTFGTLRNVLSLDGVQEITIEVNPGTVDREKMAFWRTLGINRMSIGVQSLKDKALVQLNRLQAAQDVRNAIAQAQGIFDNVSIDLILGLPGVSAADFKEQLREIVQWPIAHISMYFLMVHEFTPLYYRVQKKEVQLPCDDELVQLYCWAVNFMAEHGFKQYEISSFARQGYASLHNQAYWQRKPYRGFGVGAWSFDGTRRFRNRKNLMLYMQTMEQGGNVIDFSEELTEQQAALERIMLGLRQTRGIALSMLYEQVDARRHVQLNEHLAYCIQQGLVKSADGQIWLTPAGLAVEQDVIAYLA
jgi:oxygen-independent coproporphyrinogen-3 oxidase